MSPGLKVLYVAPGEYSGDRRNYNQLQRVLYAPSDVTVELLVAKNSPITVDLPANVRVHTARLPGRLGFYLEEIRLLLRLRGADAVATTNTFEAVPAWLCRVLGRYRWVADIWDTPQKALVTYHAVARGAGARIRRAAAQLKVSVFRRALRRADLVIVSACADGLDDYRLSPDRTRVFTNAIALDELTSGVEPSREPASVCFVSSLFLADRGVDTLAEATAILRRDGIDPHVVLAGQLPADLAADGLDVLGPVPLPSAHDLMRRSEIGVLPFHDNPDLAHTQPVKLLEYMALGCVVVASDLPGFREIVRPDVDALLVPPGDAEALATALARVIGDATLRERLRASARERVALFDARTKVRAIYADIDRVCVA